MDDDHRQYSRPWRDPMHVNEWIIRETSYTEESILKKARAYKQGRFLDPMSAAKTARKCSYMRLQPMPVLELVLCRAIGQHIRTSTCDLGQTNCWLRHLLKDMICSTNHEEIYMGEGKVHGLDLDPFDRDWFEVVHVSGHGDGKGGSVLHVGRLLGDFIDKPNTTIRVVVYRMRFQTPRECRPACSRLDGQSIPCWRIPLARQELSAFCETLPDRPGRMWRHGQDTDSDQGDISRTHPTLTPLKWPAVLKFWKWSSIGFLKLLNNMEILNSWGCGSGWCNVGEHQAIPLCLVRPCENRIVTLLFPRFFNHFQETCLSFENYQVLKSLNYWNY